MTIRLQFRRAGVAGAAAVLTALAAAGAVGNASTTTAPASPAAAADSKPADATVADVWPCGSVFCTTAVNDAPVHGAIDPAPSPAKYVVPRGSVIAIECWSTKRGNTTWYWGGVGEDGTAYGFVDGYNLATGQDPNPQIPLCMG